MFNKSFAHEITPRHVLFNVLAHCGGRISRKDLMGDVHALSTGLAEKGFKVAAVLKGSQGVGWWGEAIDGELLHWMGSGIIREQEPDLYEFVAGSNKPFSSLQDVVMLVNSGLHDEVRRTLDELTKLVVQCNSK